MPELPEVEVTRMGISPHLIGQKINKVAVYNAKMRWPIPLEINQLTDQVIEKIDRRAKYLLLYCQAGIALLHLGMSGKLCVVDSTMPKKKHDHFELFLGSGKSLRLNDPRRFGAVLWFKTLEDASLVLAHLGPEPLTDEFTAEYLHQKAQKRQTAIKTFLMDNKVVVGVGNIYANESLFMSGIHPKKAAGKISFKQYQLLVENIKQVLAKAITQGGTTLKDFTQADGKPGYFAQELMVYGRAGEKCKICQTELTGLVIAQRATVFCKKCQK
ncbi:bifunctional DNA-formamidopyrimidine glycosylase/DNA-(apurinic or apyrimidinic site) lyase [Catenovulum sp. 2E275]|uniref:bifunctional DNA-formamidopyrimidine glycosylase/DNA-(apurinic or apyrimidinic site) lyase n=1 Tax=Catenovulum sp. 2E275 TaxID=2980497 RepID=UPI0021D2BA6D|nr:bifunctional DNA-formamidopyrimidine glycosylase/DNA-(apurinic or apyrimidinic site) lyase [Catenovulum sp. 2E275]MCU4676627.1 bifunctional DNA-formamidopyrimidine glycosylase/DNA-(apurinic or apyrimidinic site) lyase [Catenovulum sp. 2E275]